MTALNSYRVTVNTDRDNEDDDDSAIEILAAHSDAEIQRADVRAGQVCTCPHTAFCMSPPRPRGHRRLEGQFGTVCAHSWFNLEDTWGSLYICEPLAVKDCLK